MFHLVSFSHCHSGGYFGIDIFDIRLDFTDLLLEIAFVQTLGKYELIEVFINWLDRTFLIRSCGFFFDKICATFNLRLHRGRLMHRKSEKSVIFLDRLLVPNYIASF